ncbi:hypothetical protein ACU686_15525 [Yinghuangia aomiensis]
MARRPGRTDRGPARPDLAQPHADGGERRAGRAGRRPRRGGHSRAVEADVRAPHPSRWWPVLVYGPWAVAALSILRAGIYRRHALHSWIVVLTFAALSMALSVPYASTDARAVVAAVLPATAMTACLHQLVRQTTLTRPPLAKIPAQRRWRT